MFKCYKYCYYRFVSKLNRLGFADDYSGLTRNRNYTSSMALVSLIQLSNVNTLLILPVLLLKRQLPEFVFYVILAAIVIYNFFILDIWKLYGEAEERWKDESPQSRKTNKWLIILLIVASVVMMYFAVTIVYIPHRLTTPH